MSTSLRIIQNRRREMDQVRIVSDLCHLLKVSELDLANHVLRPQYSTYKIKKKNGGLRLIEDPCDELKNIQDKLNDYLQAIYHKIKPGAVYGFCVSTPNEEARNIITNAKRHMGQPYMLNIDFKEFFHQIKTSKVEWILKNYLPNKDKDLYHMLSKICTYKGRLPMGAPTSPALSNFATIDLDHELMTIAKMYDVKYTRYADDLTFSSEQEIDGLFYNMIRDAIVQKGLEINLSKTKHYKPADDKIVTGIIVKEDHLELQKDYMLQLEKEITLYRNTILIDTIYETGMSGKKIKLFRQEIIGKLNFAYMVMPESEEVIKLNQYFEEEVNYEFESKSWLDIPYIF